MKLHISSRRKGRCDVSPNASKNLLYAMPLALLLVSASALANPSASEGKAISGQCAACHGSDGIAVNTQYPNLAGQNYQYLVRALTHFKKGERSSPIMQGIAHGLSKAQIRDLADYYSSLNDIACSSPKSHNNKSG